MQNEQNEILLHNGTHGWLATFVGPHSARLCSLFGTSTIPTAYTSGTSLETVTRGIAARNPGVTVKHWLF
jgi:hypothetical protein